jgi:hypothetical protein
VSATVLCVSILDAIELLLIGSYACLAFGAKLPAWVAVLGCAAAIAIRGASLRWKAPTRARCLVLFDRGIGLFLFALFVAAIAGVPNPFASRLAASYFLFGALALGLSERDRLGAGGTGPRRRPRPSLVAALLAVTAAAAAFIVAPSLSPAAEAAGKIVAKVAAALEPYFLAVVKLIFGYGRISVGAEGDGLGGGGAGAATGWAAAETPWLGRLVAVLVGAPIVAVLLSLAALGLASLFRRLVSLLERRVRGAGSSFLLRALLAASRAGARLFGRVEALVAELRRPRSAASRAYAKLLACGRAAAMGRLPCETPREYASRLSRSLPRSASGALDIVAAIEREAYGGLVPEAAAVRHLARLRHRTSRLAFAVERALRALGSVTNIGWK